MTERKDLASKNDVVDFKPDYSLLPKAFLDEVSYVMMAGEKKYGRYNYTKGHKTSQLIAAASRHLAAYMSGEDHDEELSLSTQRLTSHLACVAANMLMILHQQSLGTHIDDRLPATAGMVPDEFDKLDEWVVEMDVANGVGPSCACHNCSYVSHGEESKR